MSRSIANVGARPTGRLDFPFQLVPVAGFVSIGHFPSIRSQISARFQPNSRLTRTTFCYQKLCRILTFSNADAIDFSPYKTRLYCIDFTSTLTLKCLESPRGSLLHQPAWLTTSTYYKIPAYAVLSRFSHHTTLSATRGIRRIPRHSHQRSSSQTGRDQ